MRQDVLSKICEIVKVAEGAGFANAQIFAQRLRTLAVEAGEASPFRLLGTRGGNADSVTSLLTITKHVEFCAELRLIQFHDGGGLLPYGPLVPFDDKLERVIAKELWDYLGREGVTRKVLQNAMASVKIRDPASIWQQFDVRRVSRDTFRKCLYVLSQLPRGVAINRKWTYDLADAR